MRIPINMGVKGRVTATLTNTETGERKEVKGDNLILNHYLDWAMERGLGILGSTTFDRCYIGTSDVPPQPTDTTFVGTQLAMSSTGVLSKGLYQSGTKADLKLIREDLQVGKIGALAATPDGRLVFINSGESKEGALKAFKVDSQDPNNWKLLEIQVPDFSLIDFELGQVQAIGCNSNYLVVGVSYTNTGLLFKIEGDSVTYVGEIPDMMSDARKIIFVPNENRFVRVRENTLSLFDIDPDGHEVDLIYNGGRFAGQIRNIFVDEDFISVGGYRYSSSTNFPWVMCVNLSDLTGHLYNTPTSLTSNPPYAVRFISPTEFYHKRDNRYWKASLDEFGTWENELIFEGLPLYDVQELWFFGDNHMAFAGNRFLRAGQGGVPEVLNYDSLGLATSTSLYSYVFIPEEGVLFGRRLSSPYGLMVYKVRDDLIDKQSYSQQWTFPAGVGTGTVNRIGLQANSGTGQNGNNRHVAQIVLPEPLEKTEIHQLDIIWEIEVENPGVWEGIIPGGSRDGSDLNWRVTINEEQFFALVSTGYSIPANWFGVTGTPDVRIGTSNEESDLILDRENIKGEEIEYISSTAIRVVNPYVPGSLKRTIRLFLEVDQGNGQIGEIVLGGSQSNRSLARITFDPPLDKPPHEGEGADPYRIYLDLEIGWQRGESDA